MWWHIWRYFVLGRDLVMQPEPTREDQEAMNRFITCFWPTMMWNGTWCILSLPEDATAVCPQWCSSMEEDPLRCFTIFYVSSGSNRGITSSFSSYPDYERRGFKHQQFGIDSPILFSGAFEQARQTLDELLKHMKRYSKAEAMDEDEDDDDDDDD